MKNQKAMPVGGQGFVRIIIFLLVVVIVYYFVTLFSDLTKERSNNSFKLFSNILDKYTVLPLVSAETDSWKSYKNSFLSFKYPSDWMVVDCGKQDWLMIGLQPRTDQKIDCKSEYPHPNPAIFIYKEKAANTPDVYQNTPNTTTLLTTVYVDGKYGQLLTHLRPNGDFTQQEIYLEYPDFFYLISLWDKDSKETFNQILSTFKFTK